MREKLQKYGSYVLAIVLFIYYFFGLYEASIYDVSDEYYMFYIERTLKNYVPDNQLKQYSENVCFEYKMNGNYLNQGQGWSHPEANSTWCIGNESSFYVYIERLQPEYVLEIKLNGDFGYENEIFVNGIRIDKLKANDENLCSLSIPPDCLEQGINMFSIVCKDEVKKCCEVNTNLTDTRRLNLFVASIELKSEEYKN